MTNVYAWPPVGLTGWELTQSDPVSKSTGFFDDREYVSSRGRSRRLARAIVTGLGARGNAGGYVENLKRLLAGGEHLVRIEALSSVWFRRGNSPEFMSRLLTWQAAGAELLWTAGGVDLDWGGGAYRMIGSPTTDGGWPALAVTGLPPNRLVARPGQHIVLRTSGAVERGAVLTEARSDAAGAATIRTFETFTLSGRVSIGEPESIMFKALDLPRSLQQMDSDYVYEWSFQEVFADEYSSLTELDPWR